MAGKFASQSDLFAHYRARYAYFDDYQLAETFSPQADLCIVIPCFNEPDLISTLQSLADANPPKKPVEVIIVLNAVKNAADAIRIQNTKTKADFKRWKTETQTPKLRFHLLEATDLPLKKAGVGLARKVGMDEAFRQFAYLEKTGHIICLDADCTVSANYLTEAERQLRPDVRGGHFQFEHDLNAVSDNALRNGIAQYELHLRYHNQGLKFTGFPFAEHTVGSCMIVRSDVYALLGGMNQRKAGEDFYFMNKVYPGGRCITIKQAWVFPSSRVSDRVPFGTGRAQGNWLSNPALELTTYHPEIYHMVRTFFHTVQLFCAVHADDINPAIWPFLEGVKFYHHREKIRQRSSDAETFTKNFFLWFDAFQTLKLIHFLRDIGFANMPIGEAVARAPWAPENAQGATLEDKLMYYRKRERCI